MVAATERLVGVATSVLLLLAVSLVGAGPAEAASGRCAAGTGVTVVVDYGSLGGGVAIGCDSDGGGKPASSVVPDAGFPLSWVQEDPGFVCSVAGKPDPSTSCTRTPPSNAYWGLFWSDGDPATWAYASEGARSLDVPEGGSIGWRFQSSSTRSFPGAAPTGPAPEPKPEPKPSPKPSPKPTPTSSPTASSSPSSSPSSSVSAEAAEAAEQSGATDERGGATKAERKKADARADKKDGKDEKSTDKERKRAQDARDREESTDVPLETDEDEVVAGGELVAPVSAESNGLTGTDAAMLAVGGLCAAGLAASAVLMARRRRL
jgi:hypothetical protein